MRILLTIALLTFISLTNPEIVEIYELNKKYKGNHITDKITLYSSREYFRKVYNAGHQLESYEERGSWVVNQDTLILNLKEIIVLPESSESKWTKLERKDIFLLKKKFIIPIYDGKLFKIKRLKKLILM